MAEQEPRNQNPEASEQAGPDDGGAGERASSAEQEGETQASADAESAGASGESTPASGRSDAEKAKASQPSAAESLAQEALKAAQDAIANLGKPGGTPTNVAAPEAASGEDKSGSKQASASSAPSGDRNAQTPVSLPDLEQQLGESLPEGLDLLSDVNLHVKIELGRTQMYVEDVLKLRDGAVVELDKLAGDPVDVYVNGRAVARGEVLILNDNFCVRINEILASAGEQE
jgi:flagellar motor switch protein FliN/FliY